MSARRLAEMIESYLEGDSDGSDASSATTTVSGSSPTTVSLSGGTDGAGSRMRQLDELLRRVDQLSQDNEKLKKDVKRLNSNLETSALLPLLSTPSMVITGDSTNSVTAGSLSQANFGHTLTTKPADLLTALLPALMLSGGDAGGGGFGGSNMAMMALAIAASGAGGSTTIDPTMLIMIAMMGQNQSSSD